MDLSAYEIIDLTLPLTPGEEDRRLAIREGMIEHDRTYYYDVDTMSHIGTHLEAPVHFYGPGKGTTIDQIPAEQCICEAVLIDLSTLGDWADVTSPMLDEAGGKLLKPGSCAVVTARRTADRAVQLTASAAAYLADKDIGMLAIDDSIGLGTDADIIRHVHDLLMSRDVVFLERLTNLEKIGKQTFIMVALPWNVVGLDSSPVRAVALVER